MNWFYALSGEAAGPCSAAEIARLLASNTISGETRVWREGMANWARLDLQPELQGGDSSADAEGAAKPLLAESLVRPGATRPSLPPDALAGAAAKWAGYQLAGPWTRFFARSFDGALYSILLFALFYFTRPFVDVLGVDTYFTVLTLILLLPVHTAILTVFGKTPGKALFGIRAIPLNGAKHFDFLDHFFREWRVLSDGMAFNIPILSQWWMLKALGEFNKNKATSYDRGRSAVINISGNRMRTAFALVPLVPLAIVGFGILPLFSVLMPESDSPKFGFATSATSDPNAESPFFTTWENPDTRIKVTLPANWQPTSSTSRVTIFTNDHEGQFAGFVCDRHPAGILSLADYASSLGATLAAQYKLSSFQETPNPEIMEASGQALNNSPATVVISKIDERFCSIVYGAVAETAVRISHPLMTAALLKSAGAS